MVHRIPSQLCIISREAVSRLRPEAQICRRKHVKVEDDVARAHLEELFEGIVQQELPSDERAKEDAARHQSIEQRERICLQCVTGDLQYG